MSYSLRLAARGVLGGKVGVPLKTSTKESQRYLNHGRRGAVGEEGGARLFLREGGVSMKPKSITEVMRKPVVSYRVSASLSLSSEDIAEPFDEERAALDAYDMLVRQEANNIRMERITLRVVEDVEDVTPV